MKWDDIINVFRELAGSQGFYGRLLRDLEALKETDPDRYADAVSEFEAQNFRDAVDVVLYVES
jgi:hypothetical protein